MWLECGTFPIIASNNVFRYLKLDITIQVNLDDTSVTNTSKIDVNGVGIVSSRYAAISQMIYCSKLDSHLETKCIGQTAYEEAEAMANDRIRVGICHALLVQNSVEVFSVHAADVYSCRRLQ